MRGFKMTVRQYNSTWTILVILAFILGMLAHRVADRNIDIRKDNIFTHTLDNGVDAVFVFKNVLGKEDIIYIKKIIDEADTNTIPELSNLRSELSLPNLHFISYPYEYEHKIHKHRLESHAEVTKKANDVYKNALEVLGDD